MTHWTLHGTTLKAPRRMWWLWLPSSPDLKVPVRSEPFLALTTVRELFHTPSRPRSLPATRHWLEEIPQSEPRRQDLSLSRHSQYRLQQKRLTILFWKKNPERIQQGQSPSLLRPQLGSLQEPAALSAPRIRASNYPGHRTQVFAKEGHRS